MRRDRCHHHPPHQIIRKSPVEQAAGSLKGKATVFLDFPKLKPTVLFVISAQTGALFSV